ncbi:MAG: chemotaxis protein CheX [Bdellovibrionales bacterium]|nr:chemotaxis protein CheX [Bdellovibrionales bacterium]
MGKINTAFLGPFIGAAMKTVRDMCGMECELEYQGPRDKTTKKPVDIAGTIGLTGKEFRGAMIVSFPKATFLSLMARLLKERHREITPELEDGAAELTNIIFGLAKTHLNQAGHSFSMAIPSVLRGDELETNISASFTDGQTVIISTFSGPFYIEFAGEEIKEVANESSDENKAIPKLDANVLMSFVDGVKKTMKVQAQEDVVPGSPFFNKSGNEYQFEVGGQMGMNGGSFDGTFGIFFEKQTFLGMVAKLLGETPQEIHAGIEDAASEIVNIVFGTSKTVLNQQGFNLRTAIPTIVRGKNVHSIHPAKRSPIVLPFQGFGGKFWVEFAFQPTQN